VAPGDRNPFEDIETVVQVAHRGGPSARGFVLVVEAGPDAGARFVVDPSLPAPLLLGKGPVCALRLNDPQISRRHLALELDGQELRVRDLESTNGTRVNGVRASQVVVEGGERIDLGNTTLRVERMAAGGAATLPNDRRFESLVGASDEMRRLYPVLRRIAESTIPVIIEGETGTGKEALAEALHRASARAQGPFVVFDCTAVAASLLESELFGHERGAFTGAVAARPGVFEQANGGTLLIDEIGDLDAALQPKLLRAIERAEVRPVGSNRTVRVDVRVLAATRRDLDREVQEGRFRDDLFHRLAVARIELPPLRRRHGDISVLARHFWSELASGNRPRAAAEPPVELLARWELEAWPGNVRQLRNAVARHLALGDVDAGGLAAPPSSTPASGGDFLEAVIAERLPLPVARERVVHEFERRYLESVLASHGGNVTRAAQDSGIALRYFQLLRQRRRG
jgi:DNA-binding NtrC family response regulator